jgi:hypothetical protein
MADAWAILRAAHPHALLIGPAAATAAAVAVRCACLRTPLVWWAPGDEQAWPRGPVGTLIVRDVASLTAEQQQHLLAGLEAERRPLQVVALAGEPLFPLIERGRFLEALYYRLNVVCIDLSTTSPRP